MAGRRGSFLNLVGRLLASPNPPSSTGNLRILQTWRKANVTTYRRMKHRIRQRGGQERSLGFWVIRRLRKRDAVPLLETFLKTDSDFAWDAALTLSAVGGRAAFVLLTDCALGGRGDALREAAIYALATTGNARNAEMFATTLADTRVSAQVRAHCAEGLASALSGVDRCTRRFKHAIKALRKALHGDASVVQLYAAYSLGELRVASAVPELAVLAKSGSLESHAGFSVKDEALDAIQRIMERKHKGATQRR